MSGFKEIGHGLYEITEGGDRVVVTVNEHGLSSKRFGKKVHEPVTESWDRVIDFLEGQKRLL